jgi:hypothetical protein
LGLSYRRSKKLAPGLRLNVSSRGIGLSFGRRGARVSASTTGRRQVSLGWKGLRWLKRF